LDVSELLGQPLPGRAAGQGPELPGQVGLVVIAAVGGEAREHWLSRAQRALLQEPAGPVEPDHPRGGLGRQPDLRPEGGAQVPVTPAGLRGQLGDDRAAPVSSSRRQAKPASPLTPAYPSAAARRLVRT
jgi:hypothetical protein